MDKIFKALAAEFPKDAVHWRAQGTPFKDNRGTFKARALAYIDARDVMDRLDTVVGPENWQSEFTETTSGRVICRLGIFCDGAWVWKSDGAGGTQVEADKGGISDALKRAAVNWGIGRYLYRLDAPIVPCEVYEKGGKPFWKKWRENPWAYVNVMPAYQIDEGDRETCDQLKESLSQCSSLDEIENLKAMSGFRSSFNRLPQSFKDEVIAHGSAVRAELAKVEKMPGMNSDVRAAE